MEKNYIVVIVRPRTTEVMHFSDFVYAKQAYQAVARVWPNSYLTIVIAGPEQPLSTWVDPHCRPDVVALRSSLHQSLCADDDCDLSGGYAHIGPCEVCKCPLKHAIEECDAP